MSTSVVVARMPHAVAALAEAWDRSGQPSQHGIAWPRARWETTLPAFSSTFRELPDRIDRVTVTAACQSAPELSGATRAFVAAMCWGYGNVGYGPFRAKRILDANADAPASLAAAAQAVRERGPVDGYRLLANERRLRWLGPAFGTKFLCFAPQHDGHQALILDRLVAGWLSDHTDLKLNPVPWRTPTYSRYLEVAEGWADQLGITSVTLEELIFVAAASRAGGQWVT